MDTWITSTEKVAESKQTVAMDELTRINKALHTLERSGGLSAAELLDMLTQALGSSPEAAPPNLLTSEQEAALREAGSFVERMPPFAARASVETAGRSVSIVASSLTTGEVAAMLGLTQGRIRQRATARTLLSVRVNSTLRFPVFQFPDNVEVPGWDQVAPTFPPNAHPVEVAAFMDRVSTDLVVADQAVSPTNWLADGGSQQTVIDLITTAFKVHL